MSSRSILITLTLFLGACGSVASPRADRSGDTAEVVALSEATVDTAESEAPLEPTADRETDPVAETPPVDLTDVEPVIGARYLLRRGETLAHFARWSHLPVEDIATASNLSLDELYDVGTEVIVPVQGEQQVALEKRRDEHRVARVEAYLASRGGAAFTDFHEVRTGESAWSIAKDSGALPVWVLESYNPSVDLDRLRPGQQLLVPIIADVVVDSSDAPEPTERVEDVMGIDVDVDLTTEVGGELEIP